ncbi:cyclohydrolase [Cryptococcus deuterogattii LA55]|nr:cyclohydrolase [Cryptococcus deuterogattii LA55]KIR70805.1 cyclohydrolase [Cryptococcus deuterogattii CA1014]KIR90417.1 cyclohydrolase [Cryptococcus deuterogattii CBS 10090]KIR97149.1 cyclohydrolase [Cryptococcus deuterogattii 2001/935-1]
MTNLLTSRAQLKNHTCSCGAQYHYDPTAHHSPPTSPSAGGVDTFRASRGSISSLSGLLGTSPLSTSGFSPTLNDVTNGNDTSNRSSTPYGNLSLDAAARGAGAPGGLVPPEKDAKKKHKSFYPSRVVLTTTARERGPVVCSRIKSNLPIRNAIGAHAGSYSIYRALSIAMGQLRPDWRPDLTNTHPPFVLPPTDGWFGNKIVSFDPWGAMSQEVWAKEYAAGLDVRPTISQTKAHIKIQELDELFRKGEFPCDGEIVIKSPDLPAFPGVDQGIEVNTYKAAIDPVWYLPGIADRLGIEEGILRRALFEDTGGMYPELLTRPDIMTFLPPIGGMTVYIMGDPAKLQDPNTEVTCRPHDSCSGSDVFGSDICTCRPYLIFGISEAIKCAQRGGVGVIVYFQKEGRALGEVVKYMVYNRRKRGGDTAAEYFNNTERVAGVKDARHQALMPDVLHFLGIKHIHNLISMSNMKYDAIVGSGITVGKRYEIPDELIPADGRVEIDAKIQSGYFSKKEVTEEHVKETKGRNWEDIIH